MCRLIPCLVVVIAVPGCPCAERVDNVLARLVPADSVSIFGARMDQIRTTPLYTKLVAGQKLQQLDSFATETGFDPRRDVRELLVASNNKPNSGVLLARGNFHIGNIKDSKIVQYKGYAIVTTPKEDAGFCILDATLAVAGPIESVKAALDQYKMGNKDATAALLTRARAVPANAQVWAVSIGNSNFLASNIPHDGNAANFGKIFRSLSNTDFEADLSHGLSAMAEGECGTDADAKNLSDAARGLIGFGRLSVPDGQMELLRIWDGIHVEQQQRKITITANIPQELIDKLVQFFESGNARPNMPLMPHMPPTPPRAPRPNH